jgi:hypothetical protein
VKTLGVGMRSCAPRARFSPRRSSTAAGLPTSAPDSRFLYINHARTDSSDESSTTDSYAGAHVKMSDYFFAHAPGRAPQISDIAKWFHHVVASENANT